MHQLSTVIDKEEAYKVNIGIDIDGVISNFVKTFSGLIESKYGVVLKETDIYCHDLNLVLGITKKEAVQLIRETLKEDLELNPDSKETLERLYSAGHKIIILTARPHDLLDVTKTWLKKKGIPYTELVQLNEGEKYLAEVDLDLIIEDNLEDALEWSQRVNNILIYDHPWNKTLNVKHLIKRVYNWNEIFEEVQRLSERASQNIRECVSNNIEP